MGKADDSANEALASCRNKPFSAVVQTCIKDLASKKKSIYEEVFKKFVTDVKASRKDFFNYPEFINSITIAKKNWDSYLNNECLAEAYIYEKESYAYIQRIIYV